MKEVKQTLSYPILFVFVTPLLYLSSVSYAATDLAFDPTKPSFYTTKKTQKKTVKKPVKKRIPRYSLQSVLIGGNRRVATINNKAYLQGEKIDSTAKLINVMPNYVEIGRNSKKMKIFLFKNKIRQ